MPKAKKKPTEGSPPKWFIRFPKPKRKAREWDVWVWALDGQIRTYPASHVCRCEKIRVREVIPRKRGKR